MKHVVLCVSTLNGKGKKNDHIYYERVGKICFDGVGTEWVYNGRTGNTHTYRPYIDTAREIMIRMQPSVRPVGSVRCCAAFSETSMGVMCVCVCVCVKTIVITKQ